MWRGARVVTTQLISAEGRCSSGREACWAANAATPDTTHLVRRCAVRVPSRCAELAPHQSGSDRLRRAIMALTTCSSVGDGALARRCELAFKSLDLTLVHVASEGMDEGSDRGRQGYRDAVGRVAQASRIAGGASADPCVVIRATLGWLSHAVAGAQHRFVHSRGLRGRQPSCFISMLSISRVWPSLAAARMTSGVLRVRSSPVGGSRSLCLRTLT